MDLKKFALQDWVERDLLILKHINSIDNFTDPLSKPMGKELHARHTEYLLGKIIPLFASVRSDPSCTVPT